MFKNYGALMVLAIGFTAHAAERGRLKTFDFDARGKLKIVGVNPANVRVKRIDGEYVSVDFRGVDFQLQRSGHSAKGLLTVSDPDRQYKVEVPENVAVKIVDENGQAHRLRKDKTEAHDLFDDLAPAAASSRNTRRAKKALAAAAARVAQPAPLLRSEATVSPSEGESWSPCSSTSTSAASTPTSSAQATPELPRKEAKTTQPKQQRARSYSVPSLPLTHPVVSTAAYATPQTVAQPAHTPLARGPREPFPYKRRRKQTTQAQNPALSTPAAPVALAAAAAVSQTSGVEEIEVAPQRGRQLHPAPAITLPTSLTKEEEAKEGKRRCIIS